MFDFAGGHARLRALWPDVTLADVAEATGFDLRVDLVDGLLDTADATPSSPPCARSTRSACGGSSSAPTS